MKEQRITVEIDREGRITADAEGFTGDACLRDLERLLDGLSPGRHCNTGPQAGRQHGPRHHHAHSNRGEEAMSAYITLMTPMTDEECLLAALADVGFDRTKVEVHASPAHLVGYQGDRRAQTANLVIRRQHVGGSSSTSDSWPRPPDTRRLSVATTIPGLDWVG